MSAILNHMANTEHRLRKALWMLRGWMLRSYLRLHGCRVGTKLKCKQWPTFRQVPRGNISFGQAVTIGYRVTLDVGSGAMLDVGDNVNLTQDLLISCAGRVSIGRYSGIGEFSSIRDSEHGYAKNEIIHAQTANVQSVHIGADVQISMGCTILPGSRIEDGVIVGTRTVVTNRLTTKEYGVYLGMPAKFIGMRQG